jgi:hypothetical protein
MQDGIEERLPRRRPRLADSAIDDEESRDLATKVGDLLAKLIFHKSISLFTSSTRPTITPSYLILDAFKRASCHHYLRKASPRQRQELLLKTPRSTHLDAKSSGIEGINTCDNV